MSLQILVGSRYLPVQMLRGWQACNHSALMPKKIAKFRLSWDRAVSHKNKIVLC